MFYINLRDPVLASQITVPNWSTSAMRNLFKELKKNYGAFHDYYSRGGKNITGFE